MKEFVEKNSQSVRKKTGKGSSLSVNTLNMDKIEVTQLPNRNKELYLRGVRRRTA